MSAEQKLETQTALLIAGGKHLGDQNHFLSCYEQGKLSTVKSYTENINGTLKANPDGYMD